MLKIKTPCSSANIGPGFDCLGIAFGIYNHFTFKPGAHNSYSGFAEKYCNDGNMVYKSYKAAAESLGRQAAPVEISFHGQVPAARGLGSSSTCIVAGVTAAYELAGVPYTKNDLAYTASLIEGHPDNVTPCVYGGFTDAVLTADGDRERLVVENFGIHKSYKFYALIPDFELSTKLSRDVLPKAVGLTAAKKNIANVPLLIKALENGDGDLLRVASEDWLHQPYRGGIIAGYFDIRQRALDAGACAVFLSGAGPTMLAVSTVDMKKQLADITSDMENTWQVKRIKVDFDGVTVERT